MDISIYTTLFNHTFFEVEKTINNFCLLGTEVIIATIPDEDNTFEFLQKYKNIYPNLKIVESLNIKRFTPTFDGALKNYALSFCVYDIRLQLDFDEQVILKDKYKWNIASNILMNSKASSLMLPSINIFGDKTKFRSLTNKWYLHKKNVFRGVVNFAKMKDGLHSIELSDSCEAILENGDLSPSMQFYQLTDNPEEDLKQIKENDIPFVLHFGYEDLERRDKLNKKHWNRQWNSESGEEVKLDDIQKLQQYKTYIHGLEI